MHPIEKTIAQLMPFISKPVVELGDTTADALLAMSKTGVAGVIVLSSGEVVGIFTERDYLMRVVAVGLDPKITPVRDVMTYNPECLREDASIAFAVHHMAVKGITNIPIVTQTGTFRTLLGVRDVLGHLVRLFNEVEMNTSSENDDLEWTDLGGTG